MIAEDRYWIDTTTSLQTERKSSVKVEPELSREHSDCRVVGVLAVGVPTKRPSGGRAFPSVATTQSLSPSLAFASSLRFLLDRHRFD